MHDKELLELAAKAAGIDGKYTDFYTGDYYYQGETEGIETGGGVWNPLNDDGDALRLAVKLTMHVDVLSNMTRVEIPQYDIWLIEHADNSPSKYPQAKYEAARRAIVRAAAEIGKTL